SVPVADAIVSTGTLAPKDRCPPAPGGWAGEKSWSTRSARTCAPRSPARSTWRRSPAPTPRSSATSTTTASAARATSTTSRPKARGARTCRAPAPRLTGSHPLLQLFDLVLPDLVDHRVAQRLQRVVHRDRRVLRDRAG